MATVTTYICANPAAAAIDFYVRAFGAIEKYRLPNPDGTLGHAEISIGDTTIMISDEAPALGVLSPLRSEGHSISFVIEVENSDEAVARAVSAGATLTRPIKDEPYGRGGWIADPYGYHWNVFVPNPDFDPSSM